MSHSKRTTRKGGDKTAPVASIDSLDLPLTPEQIQQQQIQLDFVNEVYQRLQDTDAIKEQVKSLYTQFSNQNYNIPNDNNDNDDDNDDDNDEPIMAFLEHFEKVLGSLSRTLQSVNSYIDAMRNAPDADIPPEVINTPDFRYQQNKVDRTYIKHFKDAIIDIQRYFDLDEDVNDYVNLMNTEDDKDKRDEYKPDFIDLLETQKEQLESAINHLDVAVEYFEGGKAGNQLLQEHLRQKYLEKVERMIHTLEFIPNTQEVQQDNTGCVGDNCTTTGGRKRKSKKAKSVANKSNKSKKSKKSNKSKKANKSNKSKKSTKSNKKK